MILLPCSTLCYQLGFGFDRRIDIMVFEFGEIFEGRMHYWGKTPFLPQEQANPDSRS